MKHLVGRRFLVATGVSMLLVLGACGSDSTQVTTPAANSGDPGDAAGGTSLAGSDDAGRNDTPDSDIGTDTEPGAPAPEPGPKVVKPQGGMSNVRPVTWESAAPTGDRVVRVQFYGGIEPCDVLDSVKVAYRKAAVEISLFSGSDPAAPDVACIEIAELKAVDVTLTEDLAGREIVDPTVADETATEGEQPAGEQPAGKVRGDGAATAVEPRPGMDNLRTIAFDRTEKLGNGVIRIYYTSGIEPCDVLDHVEVDYSSQAVTLTVFMGSDPASPDAICPALARFSYTDITLDEGLDGREIRDGGAL
ncbi:MAG: hypothetical protein ACT4PP_02420 [Sporichthyaceae bacterium]